MSSSIAYTVQRVARRRFTSGHCEQRQLNSDFLIRRSKIMESHDGTRKNKITPDSFHIIDELGRGTYGQVFLVQPKDCTGTQPRLMALKLQRKRKTEKKWLLTEVRVCRDLRQTPFVCQLIGSFQTKTCLCLLTEYYSGGSLWDHIKKQTPFTSTQMTVLAAELSTALIYIHRKSIVHRDIKPNNIVFDGHGHSKIIDFGLSCFKVDIDPSNCFVGNRAFWAPEFSQKHCVYDRMVDWWALGITLLVMVYNFDPVELLCAHPVYAEDLKENIVGFIMTRGRTWHKFRIFSQTFHSFLLDLLTVSPSSRLGAGGEGEIMGHRLFQDADLLTNETKWRQLVLGQLPPPLDAQYHLTGTGHAVVDNFTPENDGHDEIPPHLYYEGYDTSLDDEDREKENIQSSVCHTESDRYSSCSAFCADISASLRENRIPTLRKIWTGNYPIFIILFVFACVFLCLCLCRLLV